MGHVTKLEGLSERISNAFRLSESEIFKAGSMKIPKSVEYNEINSNVSIIETSEHENIENHSLSEILQEPINKVLSETYIKCFLVKRNPKKLMKLFCRENCRLIKSEIKKVDFSIKEIMMRLKDGYVVYKYTHKNKLRKFTRIRVDQSLLMIRSGSKCAKLISFESIYGVILGCETFEFKRVKTKIDMDCGVIHNDFNCFSIVTDTVTYDLASNNELSLYDLCIGISWLSYHYNSIPTSIPYSKYTLSFSIVSMKLKQAAKLRYMSIVELFMVTSKKLAICKTLKELGRSRKQIIKLLNKRFDSEGKIYRFVVRSLIDVVRKQLTKSELRTNVRVSLLANIQPETKNQFFKRTSIFIAKKKKTLTRPQAFIAFFVPSSTKIFEKPRKIGETGRKRYTSILRHASIFGLLEVKKCESCTHVT